MRRGRFQLPPRDPGRPKVPEVAALVQRFYELPGNEAGGHLHVVLDDENLKDCFLTSAYSECLDIGDYAAARIAALMLRMTPTQRRKVVRRQVRLAQGPFTYEQNEIHPLPVHGVLGRPKASP